jgi:porphobilinogen deaminase
VSLDGKERIALQVSGPIEQAEQLGEQLAKQVLDAGGKRILADIKQNPH